MIKPLRGAVLLCSLITSAPAMAADEGAALFAPPSGLVLLPSHREDGSTRGSPYGETAESANWTVAQWDIPEDLPPFKNNITANQYASVHFTPATATVALAQDGAALPCTKIFPSGKKLVDEFDLLLAPATHNFPMLQQATMTGRVPLSALTQIAFSGTLTPSAPTIVNSACKVSQAVAGIGIVVTNINARQTFFYQLSFVAYRVQGQSMPLAALPANWFFTGHNMQAGKANQYGYGDRLWTSYGILPLTEGKPSTININVLPRITQLITQGQKYGMDQNLSHWAVTGMYYGQSIFGHVRFDSTWQSVSLKSR